MILYYYVGDTSPKFVARLLDAKGRSALKDGAAVTLEFAHSDDAAGKVKSVAITSVQNGDVESDFPEEGDLNKPGTYYATLKVLYPDGSVAHIPNSERMEIRVMDAIPVVAPDG